MKRVLILPAILLLCAITSFADDLPKRKAGLWEIQVASDKMPATTMKQCVDEQTDIDIQEMSGQMKEMCSRNELKRTMSGYTMESDCKVGSSRVVSSGTLTGDFTTSYTMDMKSKYEPPMMGMTGGTTKMTARHLGACEPGQRPGDMVLPGGMKMNINDMKGMKHSMPMPKR